MKKSISIMLNLQTHHLIKLDFQNVGQHTGGKWLIHDTKHRTDNQFQNLEPPVEYPSRQSQHDIEESEGYMFNPIFKGSVRPGLKHPGTCAVADPVLRGLESLNMVVQNKKEWP